MELRFVTKEGNDGVYQGTMLKNQKHGEGCFFWDTGELYVGDWRFNKMEGEGIFFFAYGGYMIGNFENS